MDISTRDFLYSAQCGFEFEFFSNLNRNEIVDSLGKTLGKKILLFDDVMTTGATVENCAKALRKCGVEKITILTIAKTIFD